MAQPIYKPEPYTPNSSPSSIEDVSRASWEEFHRISDYLVGNDRDFYIDVNFPIIIRTTGANIPTLTTLNGNLTMPQWAVNDYNMCESNELVHGWKEGSQVNVHLHMTTNGTDVTDRYVKFEIEYGYADIGGVWVFPTVVTTADILIPANTPTKTHQVVSLFQFTPTAKIGSHMIFRLKRVAASGTAPTSSPWIPMLQAHIICDTKGSRTIQNK